MNTNDAVAKRITQLLAERNISQYKLEQKSGVYHGAMNRIMTSKNKSVTLVTVYKLAHAFDMSVVEFLDDEIFCFDEIEIE